MVMLKTVNGIAIQFKLNGYAEDSQRHNHPIQVEVTLWQFTGSLITTSSQNAGNAIS